MADSKHRNDIYGDNPESGEAPPIPAATVVLLRMQGELEVLMLHKTSQIAFGGMWVFPGGRIDPEDYPADGDMDTAARNAAVRETREEAGIESGAGDFVFFAHWTPPPGVPKRFATWFFAAETDSHEVRIDGGEIQDHQWLAPAEALRRHAAGEIDLAPPTWVTLYDLSRARDAGDALDRFRARGAPRVYETRIGQRNDGVRVAMWVGDAGYAARDASLPGPRHRLNMAKGGFVFDHDAVAY
ncbi:MAG: NUDIX hydrolase [Pseudomonadales bacterium]|nr:NUDIX hydrolase [Pseudomonadales bacterium]